jgi:hypothetical protein
MGPMVDHEIAGALAFLAHVPFEELQERGWHLQPNNYYWPLNDLRFLREHPEIWTRFEVPDGVAWHFEEQLRLLESIAQYAAELASVQDGPPAHPGEFVWSNPYFPPGDAFAYYGVVRHLEPQRVIEVGAGWSSLLLAKAVAANADGCEVTLIEPEPRWDVLGELPSGWKLVENLVQLTDLALFDALGPGDVLFYDGSHSVHTGSDVNWIFFKVLPRLAPGVWIHVHDLFWPSDYPPAWILDEGLSWNEQYLVQGFLMGNTSYRVRLAVSLLDLLHGSEVAAMYGSRAPGGSLWIEKLPEPSAPASA